MRGASSGYPNKSVFVPFKSESMFSAHPTQGQETIACLATAACTCRWARRAKVIPGKYTAPRLHLQVRGWRRIVVVLADWQINNHRFNDDKHAFSLFLVKWPPFWNDDTAGNWTHLEDEVIQSRSASDRQLRGSAADSSPARTVCRPVNLSWRELGLGAWAGGEQEFKLFDWPSQKNVIVLPLTHRYTSPFSLSG